MSEPPPREPPRDAGGPSLEDRLSRAFSLRRNARQLLTPPSGHLRPLDGLRALSILWVVVFHTGWYAAPHIPIPTYAELLFAKWMLPVWRGDFGVDVFFVLSGFLIAGMLIDEKASTGRLRLGLFYLRRLIRLWPALGVAVLLDVVFIGDHPNMVWANLLYVSNFIPILQAAMGWTWSLAIEEQFYLVCPWLVGGLALVSDRARLQVIGAIVLALTAIGAWVVIANDLHAVDAEIVVTRHITLWAVGYDHLYVKPWMRAGALLCGVAAAYLYRTPRFMEALARRQDQMIFGLLGALVAGAIAMHWPLAEGLPRPLEVLYLATFRSVFGAVVAFVLLLSLSEHPLGKTIGKALSAPILYPFGQLAYSAYLLNPIVCTLVHHALAPRVWQDHVPPIPLFLPFDFLATFGSAAIVHLFVERPFMELRPRARAV